MNNHLVQTQILNIIFTSLRIREISFLSILQCYVLRKYMKREIKIFEKRKYRKPYDDSYPL